MASHKERAPECEVDSSEQQPKNKTKSNYRNHRPKPRNTTRRPVIGPHHRSVQAKPPFQFLHKLPFEIREIIYGNCLEWNGRSPAIFRALRASKLLYPQVIEQFYKADNTFYLNKRNGWSLCSMSVKALVSVRKLKIEIQ
jgi:hypothetical protein